MLSEQTREREAKLIDLLKELSNEAIDENRCEEISSRFREIYRGGFRHRYSAFHPMLSEIIASSDAEQGVAEFLIYNLNVISAYIENKYITNGQSEDTKIYRPIYKLCDHINLEMARINEQRRQEMRLQELYAQIQVAQNNQERASADAEEAARRAASALEKSEEASKHSEKARKKVNRAQSDVLAILSVFAAVILAFMGGMTFLGGAMSSISETRVYKFVITCCICGFIIFNTIFLLLYIVSKIIEKPIYARCESPDCTCDNGKPKCRVLNRLRKRLPYVFYFNVCTLALLLAVVFVQYGVPVIESWCDSQVATDVPVPEDVPDKVASDDGATSPENVQVSE